MAAADADKKALEDIVQAAEARKQLAQKRHTDGVVDVETQAERILARCTALVEQAPQHKVRWGCCEALVAQHIAV